MNHFQDISTSILLFKLGIPPELYMTHLDCKYLIPQMVKNFLLYYLKQNIFTNFIIQFY